MSEDFDIQAGSRDMTPDEAAAKYPGAATEAAHCVLVAQTAAVTRDAWTGEWTLGVDQVASLLVIERQAAREPLEARVRELEAIVAAHTEASMDALNQVGSAYDAMFPRETFDQESVRGLLASVDALASASTRIYGNEYAVPALLNEQLSAAAARVRESEKK